MSESTKQHIMAVLVDNEPGVLARVIGLFSGRGYNIESLTVAEVSPKEGLSRITIVTSGTAMVIEQIKAQLERLVPVYKVADLTEEGPAIAHEMALVKVADTPARRVEVLEIANNFKARMVDSTSGAFIFEITGESAHIDSFIALMNGAGLIDFCRTGVLAIARGPKPL